MGLTITAYKNITVLPEEDANMFTEMGLSYIEVEVDTFAKRDLLHDYLDRRYKGVINISTSEEGERFYMGTYSSFNNFKNSICEVLFGVNIDDFRGIDYEHEPLYHFINFSDCEGCIGASMSGEIYRSLIENRKKYMKWATKQVYHESNGSPEDVYEDLIKAFNISKEQGIVIFNQ